MPTVREFLERESFFDAAILRHGFVDYMRDYEIIVSGRDGPRHRDVHRYLFVGVAELKYETTIQSFSQSLSDGFVYSGPDHPEQDDPDGFVWGVRWAAAYPGLSYHDKGERAALWSKTCDRPMHEVLIETNAYRLLLVFADIRHSYLGTEDQPGVLRQKDFPILPNEEHTSDGGVI